MDRIVIAERRVLRIGIVGVSRRERVEPDRGVGHASAGGSVSMPVSHGRPASLSAAHFAVGSPT